MRGPKLALQAAVLLSWMAFNVALGSGDLPAGGLLFLVLTALTVVAFGGDALRYLRRLRGE